MKYAPAVIYCVALGLLFMTSLQGGYLIGSDIHSEYYIAKRMMAGWDVSYPHLYNASLSTAVVAPWLSRMTHIDLVWVFKVVYPMMFASVPVILYVAYRKMIGGWRALFAVLFFMSVPVFFLELPQLPRQMLAEVFFALIVLAMASGWRLRYKMTCIAVCLPLTIVLHWSIGLISIALMACLIIALLITKPIKWGLMQNRTLNLAALSTITIVCIIGAGIWGSKVAQGLPMRGLSVATGIVTNIIEPKPSIEYTEGEVPWDMLGPPKLEIPIKSEPLMRAATGGDFNEATIWGKLFRIVQYITQGLIITGAIWLLLRYRRYKFNAEFIICIGAVFGLLLCCVVIPNFSYILNLTRFYHAALFFLAPMLVLGVDAITNNKGGL